MIAPANCLQIAGKWATVLTGSYAATSTGVVLRTSSHVVRNIGHSQVVRGHLSYVASQTTEYIEATASDECCAAYHSRWRYMVVGFVADSLITCTVDLNVNRADGGTLSAVEKRSLSLDCKGYTHWRKPLSTADEACTSLKFIMRFMWNLKWSINDTGEQPRS